MTIETKAVPSISVTYAHNGRSTKANALGMRPMQELAYERRGEQYLLIKSPPASGKSRALMFIALDKLQHQGLKQAIIVVPEKAIGASFHDEPLTQFGFSADWHVDPKWNLCNAPGGDNGGKVNAVGAFLASTDRVLVCTHATFRFAVDAYGVEKFDDRLIAVDEFHHVSVSQDNKLGLQLEQLISRDRVHVVAMTGSYFRGDAEAVLAPDAEAKFDMVTYTYYQQLNGYEYLKQLDIGYFFYSGSYVDDILHVLDPEEKTIIHIPNVNSRESTKDKIREVDHIIGALGEWQGIDPATGFQLVKTPDGRVLRIADLVDDDPARRDRVSISLKDPAQKHNRDYVDIIIALGMAKEGFDWIWCDHALTVGYRSSLTEIVQIIGRATRDAPGKTRTRFTNLIAEPDASEEAVTEAVNDTLKAIAASLLMEQVLAPRFEFKPKHQENGPAPGFDYGEGGYDPNKCNVGFNEQTGQFQIEIKGLAEPKGKEATRICQEDLNEVIAAFVQDKTALERGLFDEELVPEELTRVRMGRIVKEKYPELDEGDQEAVRQHAIAALNLTEQAKKFGLGHSSEGNAEPSANTALVDGVRRFAMDARELDIDLIDSINPFREAYSILSIGMNEDNLKQVAAAISAKKTKLTPEEAKDLAIRAMKFKKGRGRIPSLDSQDVWARRMAEGAAAFMRFDREGYMSEIDLDELRSELSDFAEPDTKGGRSPREERIIAGFEEVQRFVEKHGRAPQHGEEQDIFERLYAVRLDRLRALEECRALLAPLDHQGLLSVAGTAVAAAPTMVDDDELLAELKEAAGPGSITELRHVRKSADKRAAEEIANRAVCEDFETFRALFERVQRELKSGVRKTLPVHHMDEIKLAEIQKGEYFILGGQIAYVAEMGEDFTTQYDRRDSRLRVIYDNGTESNLLIRSFQRALYRDAAGRLITNPETGPLFADQPADDDLASGTIYVLRSNSEHPLVAANRDVLHKIGVTGGKVETRIANASLDPTFLMAEVDVIASYQLYNINRVKLENIIHRVFDPALLDIEIKDRFGNPVRPREWFLVPLFVVNEAVERIKDGTITQYVYDPNSACLAKINIDMSAGAKIDHEAPRDRGFVAV